MGGIRPAGSDPWDPHTARGGRRLASCSPRNFGKFVCRKSHALLDAARQGLSRTPGFLGSGEPQGAHRLEQRLFSSACLFLGTDSGDGKRALWKCDGSITLLSHCFPTPDCLLKIAEGFCGQALTQSACLLSRFGHVQLCVSLWTVARQAPPSMEFSRQAKILKSVAFPFSRGSSRPRDQAHIS